jgi:NitT/TauT family transport system permease protein
MFGLHARPSRWTAILLGILPFILVFVLYNTVSKKKREENPSYKMMPSVSQMVTAVNNFAFTPSKRTGEYVMLTDTVSSLKRLTVGVTVAAFLGFFIGTRAGTYRLLGALTYPFLVFISIIPPLAVLPIILMVYGVDEFGKIMLIIIGLTPGIARSVYQATIELPKEQMIKALTLGSSQYITWVVEPQILPQLINTVRISFGAAWLFLIASEAIAAQSGLGYQIFIQRRFTNMDIIIPYVLWITILGFTIDMILRLVNKVAFRWYEESTQQGN